MSANCRCEGCPTRAACQKSTARVVSRRRFLHATTALALGSRLDLMHAASLVSAAEAAPAEKPRVAVVYFRKELGGGCVWPPSSTDELAWTVQLENKILQDAAARYGVDLKVVTERVTDVAVTLQQVQQLKPHGIIVVAMDFTLPPMLEFCQKRGEIPTIMYGNILGFTHSFDALRKLPKFLIAHSPDVKWLDTAVRMQRTLWDLDRLKLLDCPCPGYYEELKKVGATAEVKAIADFYAKQATSVEPACPTS